jgi:hypothetical protein
MRVPFEEFLAGFARAWEQGWHTAEDVDQRSDLDLTGLYEHLLAHRKLLLALIRAAQGDGAEVSALMSGASSPVRRYFDRVEYLAGRNSAAACFGSRDATSTGSRSGRDARGVPVEDALKEVVENQFVRYHEHRALVVDPWSTKGIRAAPREVFGQRCT